MDLVEEYLKDPLAWNIHGAIDLYPNVKGYTPNKIWWGGGHKMSKQKLIKESFLTLNYFRVSF